jgi:hypothetical protein
MKPDQKEKGFDLEFEAKHSQEKNPKIKGCMEWWESYCRRNSAGYLMRLYKRGFVPPIT